MKPLVSGLTFDEIEREFLTNVNHESGTPLLLERLEKKEKTLSYRAKDVADRATTVFAEKLKSQNVDIPYEERMRLEEDMYTLFMMGYIMHSKCADAKFDSEFGDLFKGIGDN